MYAHRSRILPLFIAMPTIQASPKDVPAKRRAGKTSFDKAADDGTLASNFLVEVLDSFERSGLRGAQLRLHRLRKEMAPMLSPKNREKLDRQLFDALVAYFVDET